MISIYQAANLTDAHLIRHLLQEERIDAYIAGEYLQGALGEIPANTPIDVRVAPADAARARRIVEEWERSPIDTAAFEDDETADADTAAMTDPTQRPHFRVFAAIVWLISGAALGASAMWAANHGPRNETGIDYNGDGVLDERWIYAGDRIERVEIDRNRDRRLDVIFDYDDRGFVARSQTDRDFDGTMEESAEYRHGQPVRTDLDRDRDGRSEYRAEYIAGTIFREEWLNANGDVVKRIEYVRGDPREGAIDSDGDGRLDTARVYDPNGEIVSAAPLDAR